MPTAVRSLQLRQEEVGGGSAMQTTSNNPHLAGVEKSMPWLGNKPSKTKTPSQVATVHQGFSCHHIGLNIPSSAIIDLVQRNCLQKSPEPLLRSTLVFLAFFFRFLWLLGFKSFIGIFCVNCS